MIETKETEGRYFGVVLVDFFMLPLLEILPLVHSSIRGNHLS